PRVALDGAPGVNRRGAGRNGRCQDNQKCGQSRCREVDDIIEPCRGKAKGLVTRRAVADHAVGGIDSLVDGGTRKPGDGEPEGGRKEARGEALRQALDRRARAPRLIKRIHIAPNDVRYSVAPGGKAVLFQLRRHGRDMTIETMLRYQRAAGERDADGGKW